MIERIIGRFFQKWEKISIELDLHITCLVGGSDQGKSSIIRLFRFISLNKPSGEAFIKHGEPFCKGTLYLDGHKITRRKGKGTNEYTLDDKPPYHAFGQGGVPEDITSLLNIDETNIQRQLDPPFWLSLSPQAVSKELNKIVSLDLVDSTLSNITSDLRKAKSNAEVIEDRITKAQQNLDDLAWTQQADNDLKRIEEKEQELRELDKTENKLSTLLSEHSSFEKTLTCSSELITQGTSLLSKLETLKELEKKEQALEELLKSYENNQEELCEIQNQLGRLQKELQDLTKGSCLLCGQELKTTQ